MNENDIKKLNDGLIDIIVGFSDKSISEYKSLIISMLIIKRVIDNSEKDYKQVTSESLLRDVESISKKALNEFFEYINLPDVLNIGSSNLSKLMSYLSDFDLSNESLKCDFFGDIYMDISHRFLKLDAQNNGEFFTPQFLTKSCVELLSPISKDGGVLISDITSGSGSFLESSSKHFSSDELKEVNFVCQEKNKYSEFLGVVNFEMNNLNYLSYNADTIKEYSESIGAFENKIDYIFSNPPFGLKDYGYDFAKDSEEKRWDFGIPKKGDGEYAFLSTIINLLNENGKALVILPLGTLFKDSTKDIRKKYIEENLVEAIIQLPPKLFANTDIPVCIWILNKNKETEDVYFVNSSEDFTVNGKKNIWNSQKTINAFQNKTTTELSGFVDRDTLKENNFNLGVQRYFYKEEEKEVIDIVKLNKESKELYKEILEKQKEMDKMFEMIQEVQNENNKKQ